MKIAFLGDIALFGKFSTSKNDRDGILKRLLPVKGILKGYDIVVANLETPLTGSVKVCGGKSAYIKGAPEDAEILKYIGVTHVTLANNHIFDYRKKGFEDTVKALENAGIKYFGVNGIRCVEKNGGSAVSLRGYCCYSTNARGFAENGSFGVNVLDFDETQKALGQDRDEGLLTVLSVHWGQEHVNYPNYYHIQFARRLSDKYDFLLHGHHPHVVQGVEKSNGSLIAYSLGNFCFDDVYTGKSDKPLIKLSRNNRTTFIWSVETEGGKPVKSEYIPLYIGEDEYKILSAGEFGPQMKKYSEFLNTEKREYIKARNALLADYLSSRKQLRDFNWYFKRLNIESLKMMVYAGKNSRMFNLHIADKLVENKPLGVNNAVLFIGNFDTTDLNAAGRRVLGVAGIFRELGYQPVFAGVSKSADNNVSDTLSAGDGCFEYSLKASLSTASWLKVRQACRSYLKIIDQAGRENIRYIYIYGSPVLSLAMAFIIRFARKNGIPVIGDCVDWIESTGGGFIRNLIKYIDVNYLKRYLYNKASGVVVISRYLQNYYQAHNKQIVLLPPVGDFEAAAYDAKPRGREEFRFVYAGIPFAKKPDIEKSKMKDRLDIIIDIVITLNREGMRTVLDIYGITSEYYLTAVPGHRNEIEKYSDIIRFRGKTQNDAVKKEIGMSDATILVRDDNLVTKAGFSTKIAESLCLGTPVITNSTGDICDYVRDGYNGLIISGEPALAAKHIIESFVTDNKTEAIRENCRKDSPFYYKKYVGKMKRFLERI